MHCIGKITKITVKDLTRNDLQTCDTLDGFAGQAADGVAQTVNDFVERPEYFIMETSGSKFFSNLLLPAELTKELSTFFCDHRARYSVFSDMACDIIKHNIEKNI